MDIIFDSEEACRYLKMSKMTLYRHAREGLIPSFKMGNIWKFHKVFLDEWIQKRVQEDTEERSKRNLKSHSSTFAKVEQKTIVKRGSR